MTPWTDYTKNSLRVALIVSELRAGGMEKLVVHLAKGLLLKQVPTLVICLQEPGDLADELQDMGVTITALHSFSGKDIAAVWKLGRILKSFSPCVINVHDYASVPYAVLASRLIRRVPVLFTAHGLLYQGFEPLQKRYRLFSKFFAGISAVSEAVGQRHTSYLNWEKPVSIIPNGVPGFETNQQLREKIRQELQINETDTLFLAVGNPRPEKGFEDLIQAVSLLKHRIDNKNTFKVVVAGKLKDDPYCRMLKEKAAREKVEKEVVFLGFRSDTQALYNGADVFVLSSRSEGLPMVILESMMAGLPVVSTRVGGIPQMMGENGILVEPNDPEALADTMQLCLEDISKRDLIARKGKDLIESRYSMDRMVDNYIRLYADLEAKN